MYFTRVSWWKDPGFTEDGFDRLNFETVPSSGEAIVLHDASLPPLRPSRDRVFSELKVPLDYETAKLMNYLKIESVSGSTATTYYGWVDNVEVVSDSDSPLSLIHWHVDPWETYKSSLILRSGHITRRPRNTSEVPPYQNYQYRYMQIQEELVADLARPEIFVPSPDNPEASGYVTDGLSTVFWAVIKAVETITIDENNTTTRITTYTWPMSYTEETVYFQILGTTYRTPPKGVIVHGMVDEMLGISPESITGAWLSPIPPQLKQKENVGAGTTGNPYIFHFPSSTLESWTVSETEIYYYFKLSIVDFFKDVDETDYCTHPFPSPIHSSEYSRISVISWDGSKIGELPFGVEVRSVTVRAAISATEAQIIFAFNHSTQGSYANRAQGLVFSAPLPSLDITSNAWASYVYSGQRTYDVEMRRITTDRQALSIPGEVVSGATTGALVGGFSPMGAGLGALVGGIGTAITGLSEYAVDSHWYNDTVQSEVDRLHANQLNGILQTGSAYDIVMMQNRVFRLISMTFDYAARENLFSKQELMGISVDEDRPSIQSILAAHPTGFYQIANLIVGGEAPVEAKRWIKDKFAAGVRLIGGTDV